MSDLIDRQQAIDAVMECYDNDELFEVYEWKLNELPSIQHEIVRCEYCKHRDPEDKKCDCGHDILWQLPRRNDWFCADGER